MGILDRTRFCHESARTIRMVVVKASSPSVCPDEESLGQPTLGKKTRRQ